MNHGRRALFDSAMETLALRALAFGVGVGVHIAISRALGPEGRGEYALAVLGALALSVLTKVGLEHANIYLLGTAHVESERLASQNALVALVGGLTGTALLMSAPHILPSLFGAVESADLTLAALAIPFLLHIQLAAGLQNLTGIVTRQSWAALLGGAVQLGIVVGLGFLGHLHVTSALAAFLSASVLVWLLVVGGGPAGTLRVRIDGRLFAQTLRYALVVHIGLVLLFFQTRITMFIVQALLGTGPLGHYSLAVAVAESVLLAASSLAIALTPRQTHGPLGAAAALSMRGAMVGGLLTAAVGAPLAVFGATIITVVFGPQFDASYPPLLALLPGMVFMAMQRFCGVPALRANRPSRMAAIFTLGVAVNVALSVLWIPTYGLVGAAASTSVSYLATSTLFLLWAQRLAASGQV